MSVVLRPEHLYMARLRGPSISQLDGVKSQTSLALAIR